MRFLAGLLAVSLSGLAGIIYADTKSMEDMMECHTKYQVVSHRDMCDYFGFESKKGSRAGCRVKPRVAYAYTSHKIYACLYGKRGRAWGF